MLNARWENWGSLFLGIWTFLIPWTFESQVYSIGLSAAIWNFWTIGALVTCISLLALNKIKPWEEWTNFFIGLWLFISPWIFGFSDQTIYFANAIIVGIGVSILSSLALPIAIKAQKQLL